MGFSLRSVNQKPSLGAGASVKTLMKGTRHPCPKLSFEDAVNVQLRLMNREFYSRIASDYDINQGRVADVKFGRLHPGSFEEALRRKKH